MKTLIPLAITTGILSGLWGWVAVSLGLLSWAGFLGCTACGVLWALVIIHGSALAPQAEILGYIMTGVVAFLMCIQARHVLLSFVPGTFIGACATFANQGEWHNVVPSLLLGLVFGFAMKSSGLWLAARREKPKPKASSLLSE
ncbi:Inner membrane protein ycdZ [Beauveria bassiana D1-5]|uniref:Inner membrane protein ycdZ n=1 Tax=Beauveria bassiana D1-5 TaxID=1245745 RepID=A0A0A2VV01_BEABA|nr:Inner membrane protein ycdZ [Beauveria bassiana D1-5]